MATQQQIDKCLSSLAVAYPYYDKHQANPDLARQIFQRVLQDIHGALLEAAVMQWLSTTRPFHPSPGELRDMALSLVEKGDKSADEAWIEVSEAIRHIGSYGIPAWSNELIARTVDALGLWKDICMIETDKMSYARDSFLKIYKAQMTRRHEDRLMLPETRERVEQYRMAQQAGTKRLPERTGGER